jgi:cytochrome c
MKSKIAIVIAAAGLLVAGSAQASAEMADKAGCNKCHELDKKKMGPSYKDLAKKVKGKEADVVAKLKEGKGHPKSTASDADLTAIVKWIAAQ